MAGCDYRSCDVCGGKAFYDANLNYEDGTNKYAAEKPPYRVVGKDQYDDPRINQEHGMRLDYVGDWAVICTDCATTHEVVIRQIAAQDAGKGGAK